MTLNNPEATQHALTILRSGDQFQWYVIPLLVIVIYIYANEYEKGNYRVIAGGLALYMVHWFVEIINALIQHFSGHALWTVPSGTAFEIMVGVGIEISLMFSIAGLAACKMMPSTPFTNISVSPRKIVPASLKDYLTSSRMNSMRVMMSISPALVNGQSRPRRNERDGIPRQARQ